MMAFTLACAGSKMTREESWAQAQREMTDNIANRVTFETGCPVEQIKATYLDQGTVGIDACGQRMIYVIVPNGVQPAAACANPAAPTVVGQPHTWYMRYCQPILNSSSEPGAAAAADSAAAE